MSTIIGVAGLAGTGKSTFAAALTAQLNKEYCPAVLGAFAAPLHEAAGAMGFNMRDRLAKERPILFDAEAFDRRLYGALNSWLGVIPEEYLAEIYAYTLDSLYDRCETHDHRLRVSPRLFMQTVGMAGRKAAPNLWINLLYGVAAVSPGLTVVQDVRFRNEADICTHLFLIERPGVPVIPHASEQMAAALGANRQYLRTPMTRVMNSGDERELEASATWAAGMLREILGEPA